MYQKLTLEIHNGRLILEHNTSNNKIVSISVNYNNKEIFKLGHIMSKKSTLSDTCLGSHDISIDYDHANLKQEAYALFMQDSITTETLLSLGFTK